MAELPAGEAAAPALQDDAAEEAETEAVDLVSCKYTALHVCHTLVTGYKSLWHTGHG
jgi:hypothetical protein